MGDMQEHSEGGEQRGLSHCNQEGTHRLSLRTALRVMLST